MPRRVVCIEDEEDVIDLMRIIVARQGFEFFEACGGIAGIETVEQVKPDLVLLDLMMPGIDGWEVYDHLRTNPETKDIPIIIVTARVHQDARVTEMRIANDNHLVTKPFSPSQLVATINRAIGERSS